MIFPVQKFHCSLLWILFMRSIITYSAPRLRTVRDQSARLNEGSPVGPRALRLSSCGSLLQPGFVLAGSTIKLASFLFVLSSWTLVSARLGPSSSSVTYFLHLFPHLEIIMLPNSQGYCEDRRIMWEKVQDRLPTKHSLWFFHSHCPYGVSRTKTFSSSFYLSQSIRKNYTPVIHFP